MSKYHYVRCTVTGNALAESKGGTPSVKIALSPVPKEGEMPRKLWADLWLTDAAIEKTIETLEKVLGWQGKSFAELNEPAFEGREVVAVCEFEVGNDGIEREKVAYLNSTAGGGIKKAEPGSVKAIAARADGFLKLARANNPSAPKATGYKAPPAYSQDGQDHHY